MTATNKQKTIIIQKIDKLLCIFSNASWARATWTKDLNMLRLKYIYKDISLFELEKDYTFIKAMQELQLN